MDLLITIRLTEPNEEDYHKFVRDLERGQHGFEVTIEDEEWVGPAGFPIVT